MVLKPFTEVIETYFNEIESYYSNKLAQLAEEDRQEVLVFRLILNEIRVNTDPDHHWARKLEKVSKLDSEVDVEEIMMITNMI